MIYAAKELEGYAIHARDGELGSVKDLYYDDQTWVIRYFVVATGSWLNDRRVLLSAPRLTANAATVRTLSIDATKEQVRHSPPVEIDQPISRQQEQVMHDYFGWPYYWGVVPLAGGGIAPMSATVAAPYLPATPTRPDAPERAMEEGTRNEPESESHHADPHVRSLHELRGYEIAARDGSIGKVDDVLLDDASWTIRHIVIDTHKWLPGRKVLVTPHWIETVRVLSSELVVGLSREEIKHAPIYDPAAPLTEEYTDRLYEHYGRTRPPSDRS